MSDGLWNQPAMNSLVVHPEEIEGECAVLTGERSKYVAEWHELEVGVSLPVAVWGGLRGRGEVLEYRTDRCVIRLNLDTEPLPRDPLTVIVAVPRPQTIKKVLQICTLYGVQTIHFVRSDLVEKSYLASRELEDSRAAVEILKSLEQACDSIPPIVEKHYSLGRCLSQLPPGTRLIADTRSAPPLSGVSRRRFRSHSTIAVGPERGWSEREVRILEEEGFESVSLGPRILRVETAVAMMVSQVKVLRELALSEESSELESRCIPDESHL